MYKPKHWKTAGRDETRAYVHKPSVIKILLEKFISCGVGDYFTLAELVNMTQRQHLQMFFYILAFTKIN